MTVKAGPVPWALGYYAFEHAQYRLNPYTRGSISYELWDIGRKGESFFA